MCEQGQGRDEVWVEEEEEEERIGGGGVHGEGGKDSLRNGNEQK